MAGLLISVRNETEALLAWDAGAAVIDVKEPTRGPLGRADDSILRSIQAALPVDAPLSRALGELSEWATGRDAVETPGIAFHKLGLSAVGPDWAARWRAVREAAPGFASWVAVVYADWTKAAAPEPWMILDEALAAGCSGLLVDTWDKSTPSPLVADGLWADLAEAVRRRGLFLALAGSLDERAIDRLSPLAPDLFAVRGAACRGGDRLGEIDSQRVESLVQLAAQVPARRALASMVRLNRTSRSTG